ESLWIRIVQQVVGRDAVEGTDPLVLGAKAERSDGALRGAQRRAEEVAVCGSNHRRAVQLVGQADTRPEIIDVIVLLPPAVAVHADEPHAAGEIGITGNLVRKWR